MIEENDQTKQASINPENIENIKKLKNLLNSDNSDIFEILALKQKVIFDDKSEEEKINFDIWQKQFNLVFPPKDSQKKKKPNINQLNLLLSSAEEYKIKDTNKINKIKHLQEQGNNIIKEVSKIKSLLQLNIYKSNTQNINLDLNEYFIQREMKIRATKEEPISTNPVSKQQDITENKNPILSLAKELSIKPKQRKKTYKKKEDSYEADFIHDEEDSEDSEMVKNMQEINKKDSSSFKRIANALQKEAENFVNSRSRRNVNKKRDDDFVYEDDLNQEGIDKEELGLNIGEEKNEINIHNKRKKKENEGDEEYSEDSFEEKKEKKLKEKLLNKKIKRPEKKSTSKILPLNLNKENKMKSRQKALATITDILKENKYLMEEGLDFVTSLATRAEEDLAKSYPEIDFDYQKTLSNMNKTMKEIAKYKRINQFIIKGKLNLFKTAKFPFGEKFIQKLKQIEEGNKNKKSNNNQKQKTTTSLDILNQITGKNKQEKEKDKLNLNKTISGVSYRSGISFFSQSSFNEERNNDNDYNNYNYNYNNEDSIDSNEEQGNIKFSPGGNNGKNNEGPNNLEEGLGHTYDPFDLDKINTNNLLFPILYDPSLSHEEEEMIEENSSNQDNEDDYNINNIVDPPPKGSVLRIYHGKIKLNHNIIDKVSLYSFNKFEKFLKFPSFEKELILPSKAKSNEVIPYCLKQLNNNSKTELFGWIEPEPNKNNENVESTKFSELIEEFERNEKCSCLVENKIKLYIFTLGEKDEKLYKKIIKKNKFINKRFMDNLNSGNKYLVFVLLANNDDLEKEFIKKRKKMSPEIINKVDISESEEEDDLNINKNKNLRIVMEEDEENMPNSSLKKNINQEEENDNEEDEESLIDKEENEKLRVILEKNDFNIINEYIENNFKDLPLEEMAVKLQRFSADNREKLLMIIKNYSEQFPQNDNQMDVDEDNNNNMNQMQQMNNVGMMNDMNNMNQNYGINMYQNDPAINQMYLGGINNMNNIQQQNSNNPNINPNLQQLYYNQGINIYNNYNNNFK